MILVIIILMAIVIIFLLAFILKSNSISNSNKEDNYERNSNYRMESDNFYSSGNFEMEIEDVFAITGRGTVVTGLVKRGVIKKGDKVFIKKLNGSVSEDTVAGIESFRKRMDIAEAGQNICLLLKKSSKNELQKGDRITQ